MHVGSLLAARYSAVQWDMQASTLNSTQIVGGTFTQENHPPAWNQMTDFNSRHSGPWDAKRRLMLLHNLSLETCRLLSSHIHSWLWPLWSMTCVQNREVNSVLLESEHEYLSKQVYYICLHVSWVSPGGSFACHSVWQRIDLTAQHKQTEQNWFWAWIFLILIILYLCV